MHGNDRVSAKLKLLNEVDYSWNPFKNDNAVPSKLKVIPVINNFFIKDNKWVEYQDSQELLGNIVQISDDWKELNEQIKQYIKKSDYPGAIVACEKIARFQNLTLKHEIDYRLRQTASIISKWREFDKRFERAFKNMKTIWVSLIHSLIFKWRVTEFDGEIHRMVKKAHNDKDFKLLRDQLDEMNELIMKEFEKTFFSRDEHLSEILEIYQGWIETSSIEQEIKSYNEENWFGRSSFKSNCYKKHIKSAMKRLRDSLIEDENSIDEHVVKLKTIADKLQLRGFVTTRENWEQLLDNLKVRTFDSLKMFKESLKNVDVKEQMSNNVSILTTH